MTITKKLSKGERTQQKILDVGQALFARKGYESTSLRDIAERVGIREPGLYRHFDSKEAIYIAVLERGLRPLADTMTALLAETPNAKAFSELPGIMVELLSKHADMAVLFQQTLLNRQTSVATQLMDDWLAQLLNLGKRVVAAAGFELGDDDDVALRMINMFNMCTGYFAAERLLKQLSGGDVLKPELVKRQQQLVNDIQKLWMLS